MKLCTACRRHVRPDAGACPFCGEALRTSAATAVGALVLLGALGASCTSRPVDESATGASTGTSTTQPGTSSTSAATQPDPATSTTSSGTTTANSSTGEFTTTNDADSNDSGCNFYGGCPTDFGGGGLKECDPWTQDCPLGEKCMPFSNDGDSSWESLKCTMPIDPNNLGQLGDVCTTDGGGVSGVDSCDVGLMCWNLDMDGNGTCIAMCKGSPDAPTCQPGTTCMIANDGVLILCLPDCDPLIQDCSDTEVCISYMGDFVCVLDASGEEGQEYDVCEYANACDSGFFCGGPANDSSGNCDQQAIGCCLAFCDLTNPQCNSPAPVECVAWYEEGMAPPGYEDLGACVIPE